MSKAIPHMRPAFATTVVLILLGLVATSLATMVTISHSEYRQTESSIVQAQLRQLLLTASIDAEKKAICWKESPTPEHWTLNTPLSGTSVEMKITFTRPAEIQVHMLATLDRYHASQTMLFERTHSQWALVECQYE